MTTLKKRIPLGLGCLGLLGGLVFTNLPTSVSASASINATALEVAPGECTGPKNGECKSENTNPCSDTTGCNSTTKGPEEPPAVQ
ncbi:hypothetical protein D3C87_712600 [compost metagenome]